MGKLINDVIAAKRRITSKTTDLTKKPVRYDGRLIIEMPLGKTRRRMLSDATTTNYNATKLRRSLHEPLQAFI